MKLRSNLLASNWGRKKKFYNLFGLLHGPITFEDGFIRSVKSSTCLSIISDNKGVYYDATKISSLENLINSAADIERASLICKLWKFYGISKYNAERDYHCNLPSKYILVVDQIKGDLSVKYLSLIHI